MDQRDAEGDAGLRPREPDRCVDVCRTGRHTSRCDVRCSTISRRTSSRRRTIGRTWTKIVDGIRADAYVHAVREDPTRRGLLYAATQHGVYLSYDDGASWQSLSLNLPDVPVADLIVEGNELVIGTHGRGFWVLDNIAPLRQYTPSLVTADAHVFTPPTAVRSGATVRELVWLKTAPTRARLEILDSTGTVLRSFEPDTMRADSLLPNATAADSLRATPCDAAAGVARDHRRAAADRGPGSTVSIGICGAGDRAVSRHDLWGASTNGPVLPPGATRRA